MSTQELSRLSLKLLVSLGVLGSPAFAKEAVRAGGDAKIKALEAQVDEMKPGLGDIMGSIQKHHAKLYFAVSAANWGLAGYQLDEIGEGFDDVVKYHAHFKKVSTPLTGLVETFVKSQLEAVGAAVKKRDKETALKAFDALTSGCNGCHGASGQPFIVMQVPRGDEFTNQRFTP